MVCVACSPCMFDYYFSIDRCYNFNWVVRLSLRTTNAHFTAYNIYTYFIHMHIESATQNSHTCCAPQHCFYYLHPKPIHNANVGIFFDVMPWETRVWSKTGVVDGCMRLEFSVSWCLLTFGSNELFCHLTKMKNN